MYKWTQWPKKQYSWLNMHQAAISVNKDHCTGVIGRFIPWQFLPIVASRDWVTWVVLSAAILTSMRIICQHQLSVRLRRLHILSEYSAKCQYFDAHRQATHFPVWIWTFYMSEHMARAAKDPLVITIMEKAPTGAFSWSSKRPSPWSLKPMDRLQL